MDLIAVAIITILGSVIIHLGVAYRLKALRYFRKNKLLGNTLGVGLVFTLLTECGSTGVEYAATGNLYGAIVSRSISFVCSLSLAGFLVCYLEWFYDWRGQVWDGIRHPLLHKYVESTICSLIVWGCMSSIKLTVMYCLSIITMQQAFIMFGTSLTMILLGVGNLIMQLIIAWKNKRTKKQQKNQTAPN